MCGISAIFSTRERINAPALKKSVAVLQHRGPDAQQSWVGPGRQIGLGHARLSIIDLTTGNQPIANEDETLHVVHNGEFYDFEKVRDDLKARGHRFRTASDSEIVLHLYEEYGTDCLQRLRGEFAFVLWDEPNQRLFAARDRFGIKPLFYAWHAGNLFLASEVKALFAAGVPAAWDREGFYQASRFGVPHPSRSLFAGVMQVPPGHYLLAGPRSHSLHRYWDFHYPRQNGTPAPLSPAEEQDAIERFRSALDAAVRTRLRADVPVGCYLSGGIDSCSVLGLAARHASRPVKAFTLTFDDAEYDESAVAREMAQHAGADYHPIPMPARVLADHFQPAVRHAETLFFNAHGIAKFLLSRTVRDAGYKVVLTGEGADEILAGYPQFRRDLLVQTAGTRPPQETEQALRRLYDTNCVSLGTLMTETQSETREVKSLMRRLGSTPSWLAGDQARTSELDAHFSADFREEFADRNSIDCLLNELDVPGELTGRDSLSQSLYLWSKTMLPNYILTVLGDRMEMAHSVEGRLPFLDHHVVELVKDLPASMKIRGGTEKYLLREAMKPYLTDTVYRRQKHPFLAPPASREPKSALYALVREVVDSDSARSLPFFDQSRLRALFAELPNMTPEKRGMADSLLMVATSACLLQEEFHL